MPVGTSDRAPAPAAAPATDFALHPDRFFDPEPSIRRAARTLYEEMRELPRRPMKVKTGFVFYDDDT